ncbi:antibiotic biosynthesis monooxygenase [Lipingzhangella sp. LS1_29]|uniref:Antibiotic biosynthesis monooxygenase n=1 Tax=Lipingzhangella rawalii TaxID=2055835 RepID=A0ABU2H5N0_9ACTN|nr:antibiotic biosynthesis monooxygenase [Lipingzhangella rawalii]MDS1270150.1 antibiotic biosynthesis monooxygenase [Lipingzhangella rawalii]
MQTDTGFYSIIDYTVDGQETQLALVNAFTQIQEEWVRSYPGYRGAQFLVNTDGTRVFTIVRWASEADYRNFVATSDGAARMAAIENALAGLSGTAELRMTEAPTYTLAWEVTANSQHA